MGSDPTRLRIVPCWVTVVRWVTELTPREFGLLRWRWTCGLLAWVLWWKFAVRVSGETVRRYLHQAGFVWRRPRPVLGRRDPEYDQKLQGLRELLARLPSEETAVFEDEVELHLCPKVGACWMRRGQQAVVVTPGQDQKFTWLGPGSGAQGGWWCRRWRPGLVRRFLSSI